MDWELLLCSLLIKELISVDPTWQDLTNIIFLDYRFPNLIHDGICYSQFN